MTRLSSVLGTTLPALVAAVWLAAPQPVRASQFGRDGFSGNPETNGGATCAACHAPGAALPSLVLAGPTLVDAGTTHTYTATLSGGPGVTGGVGVSASGALGSFAAVNADMAPVGDEISHAQPKAFSAGSVAFSFDWTAPSFDGDVTLYAAGNSTNGLLNLLGDAIDTSQLVVTVQNGGPPPPPDPPPPPPQVALEPFASGLARPVQIRSAGDDRLFVVEQAGRIRIVRSDGSVDGTPFLDIASQVDSAGNEQGLLGLAFHPSYASNGSFFVYYTYDPGPGLDRTRVSRFQVSGDPDAADPLSETILLEFEQPFANHNGGDLHFGPDGYLYVASGDGGSGGDPSDYAQTTTTLLGKLLRLDVDGGGGAPDCDISGSGAYGVPADNAYADGPGGAGCDEIWALGLRNPWRFSFDRDTGDLWIADVGQNQYEEVDFVTAGSAAGLNFGWRCYEGDQPYNLSGCTSGYYEPVHVPTHAAGNCSITGGFVYRGQSEPGLVGRYFFSDFCLTSIRTITPSGPGFAVDVAVPTGHVSQPVTFGEDADGELYVASLTGTIYRLRDNAPVPAVPPWLLGVCAGCLGATAFVARRSAARRGARPGRPPRDRDV